jgi:PAS domain S-box-containing protein
MNEDLVERYRRLFMNLPVAAWESDWSGVVELCRREHITTVEAFEAIAADAKRFRDAGTTVRAIAVNPVALELFGVSSVEEFARFNDAYPPDSARRFAAAAGTLLFGSARSVTLELPMFRADGVPLEVLLRLARAENFHERANVVTIALDVTERRTAERALIAAREYAESLADSVRESEERYRRMFLMLPVAAWENDWSDIVAHLRSHGVSDASLLGDARHRALFREALARRRMLGANPAALELMGWRPELGDAGWQLGEIPDHSIDALAKASGQIMFADQGTVTVEVEMKRMDGRLIDAQVRFARAANWDHDKTVFAAAIDMTEAKRAEREVIAAKAYVDNLIDTANVLIVELDMDGHTTRMNRMGEVITGYTLAELRDRNWFTTLAPPEHQDVAEELLHRLREGFMPTADEAPIVDRNGQRRMIAWRNSPIVDHAGAMAGIISFGVDVTDARQAEAVQTRLRNAMVRVGEEWRLTFDSVNTPIVIADDTGRVTRLNRAARDLGNRPFSRLIGGSIEEIGQVEPWQTAGALVRGVASGSESDNTAEAKDETGRTWVLEVTKLPVGEGGDAAPRFILVLSEITSVVELQESLRRSETLSAMGNLVAGVAHEVRNPLFGISATLDAYAEELSRPGYEECASALRREVTRLTVLMQELLDYGKPTALQLAPASLHDVVGNAMRDAPLRQADIVVRNDVPADLPRLQLDASRMRQVFENLIENAMHHAPPKSEVRVSASLVEHAGQPWVQCRVEDRGPGFAAQDLERVFEPFFTRRHGGTGLGLSIVQRIVAEHAGRVTAGNAAGGGGMITILLPAANAIGSR